MNEGPVREQAYRRAGVSEHGLRSSPVNYKKLSSLCVGRAQWAENWREISMSLDFAQLEFAC